MLSARRFILWLFLAFGAIPAAQAGPIYLGLGMDASGSISPANFELQRNAYISVLEDLGPSLVANEVWISINQFATTVRNELALTQVTLASVLPGGAIRSALENMVKLGGTTNIGASVDDLVAQFQTQPTGFFDRAVIDISTDGFGPLGTAVADALAAGIGQVNCLGIGVGADCTFIGGEGSFAITVASFEDFEEALREKLETEIDDGTVSEPTLPALLLLALGLVALQRRIRSS